MTCCSLAPDHATATNKVFSGDHVTLIHETAFGAVRKVQSVPLELDMISPENATATKRVNAGDHATDHHDAVAEAAVRLVHVAPSGLVITRPLEDTAQKMPNCGLHATLRHVLFAAAVRDVHVIGDTFSNARQAGVVAELALATYDPVPATVVVDPVRAGTIDVAVGAFPKVAEGIGVFVDVTMPATPSSCVVDPSWAEARFGMLAIRVP
jgi:hypothetical protein